MNSLPKHVASTSLEEPLEWNNSYSIGDDIVGEVGKLKEQDGKISWSMAAARSRTC